MVALELRIVHDQAIESVVRDANTRQFPVALITVLAKVSHTVSTVRAAEKAKRRQTL